jgi:hypothetical protein
MRAAHGALRWRAQRRVRSYIGPNSFIGRPSPDSSGTKTTGPRSSCSMSPSTVLAQAQQDCALQPPTGATSVPPGASCALRHPPAPARQR